MAWGGLLRQELACAVSIARRVDGLWAYTATKGEFLRSMV